MPEHPTWLAEPSLPQLTTAPYQCSWLRERGSLTERLRQTWGDVAVEVIDEGLAVPLRHEADRLGQPASEPAWVRCVWLRCQGQARIHARTVIPRWGPANPWQEVQQLGRQPLGELLFRLPDLQRSPFEWNADAHWPALQAPSEALHRIARRCVFLRHGAPLLLTEVFLATTLCPRHGAAAPGL